VASFEFRVKEGLTTRWKVSKPVRITLYLMENLLVLALAVLLVMSSAWFQHVLETQVVANLENLTGGRVEIAHFRFKPWLFQITMQEVVLHGSEAAGQPPLISVHDVEIGLSPGQFLHRRLRLRHVDLDELQVHLRTNSQGISNLPVPLERISPQQGLANLMNLSIGRLTLSHAAFFWNDEMQPLALDTREVAILLHIKRGSYNGAIASSATTIRSSHWSSPTIKFNGRFDLSPARLAFSSFAWQALGTAGEASFTIIPHTLLEATGSFHASAELSALASLLHEPELRAGTLQIEGLAAYQGGIISAQGRARVRHLSILTPSFPSFLLEATASYALEKNQLDLTNLLVSGWGGAVQGTLQADFQNSPVKFRLNSRLHQVRLDSLLRSPGTPPLLASPVHPASAANGDLDATWSGRGQSLKADFDLALQAPAGAPPNTLPVSGTARGTLEDGRGLTLHLADCDLRTPHSTITARGTLTQTTASSAAAEPLALAVTADDFEEWRPFFQSSLVASSAIPLELNSRAEFSGQLSGSYEAPSLHGHVSLGQFRFQGWTWDRLTATITLNPEFVQISDGRVEHEKSTFELNSSAQLDHWRLTPASVIRLSAQAQQTPIEGLKAATNMELPVRGLVSGHVDLQGTATNLAGSGSLRIDAGAFADEPFDSFSTQLRVARSIWKMQNLQLRKNQGRMSGEITLEPERRFASGRLEGTGFRLADIRRLPTTDSLTLTKERLDGSLNFEARGQGTAADFHLQGLWGLQNLSVAGTPLGEFHGTLAGEGNELELEGENQSTGGNLHFSAKATAQGDWPMQAEGEFSSLRADPWIRAFFNREFAAAVNLGGSFRAQGPLRAPAKIDIQAHASNVAVDFPSVQWRNVQPVDVHYSAGRLELSRFVMRGPSTELEIAGTVGLTHGVALALSAEGTANATLLTVFDANLQASGRSTLHLRLTGTPDRPLMNGSMDIQDVNLDYKGLPLRFNDLQGTIKLEGERAVISSLHGICGGGTVNLSGLVTLAENPHFELQSDLNQVRIRYPPSFTSVFDGHLHLGGGVEQGQLTGDLVVRHMVLNENVNFISKIIESSNPMPEQPLGVNSPIAAKIRLNVRVTSAPPVQLQTPNLRLVGDIDLRLQGSVADPVQVGSIHFLSGESVFRGNRYTLVRGDMNMTNPFRTQTYLDLEADTRVQNYDLTLDISGPFDRLKFAYRSDPPLANTDILSLLALGYVKQEGAFATAAGNPAASVGASAILSEALSSQTTSRIQRLFGVSRIKIDPNVSMPGYGSGALVTVEQQITHDLTLTYVTDTSYSQYQIIQFEWNINDKVSVLGIRDQNGVFGVEFRFRQRFK
jgi:translocation and assembly module TamB